MTPYSNGSTSLPQKDTGHDRSGSRTWKDPPKQEKSGQVSLIRKEEKQRLGMKGRGNLSGSGSGNGDMLDHHHVFALEQQGNTDGRAPKATIPFECGGQEAPRSPRSATSSRRTPPGSPGRPTLTPKGGPHPQERRARAPNRATRDSGVKKSSASFDSSPYTTQRDVIARIEQVEDDIAMYEEMQQELEKLRSIEEATRKLKPPSDPLETGKSEDLGSATQKIYRAKQLHRLPDTDAEKEICNQILQTNRRTAKECVYFLCDKNTDAWDEEELCPKLLYPRIELYPCLEDNALYFEKLKGKIALTLYNQQQRLALKQKALKKTYKRLFEEWKHKNQLLDKLREREQRGKSKPSLSWSYHQDDIIFNGDVDALRFEPAAPGASQGGRSARGPWTSDAARSEAELLEIIQSLESADNRNPELRAKKTTAVIPDMILDRKQRARTYDDRSGLVVEPLIYYHTGADTGDTWTAQEIASFMKGYAQYPKQFQKVATMVGSKSASQCVLFYYRKKNTVDFKDLLSKGRRSKYGKKKDRSTTQRFKESQKTKGSALMADIGQARVSREENMPKQKPPSFDEEDALYLTKERVQKPSKPQARRRIGQADAANPAAVTTGRWTERERRAAVEAFKAFGRDFTAVAETVGTKSEDQCRNFYFNHKRKYGPEVFGEESRQKMTAEEDAVQALVSMMHEGDQQKEQRAGSTTSTEPQEKRPSGQSCRHLSKPDESLNDLVGGSRRGRTTYYSSYWTLPEKESFLRYLKTMGPDWEKISDALQTKTATQARNFYANNQEKLGLKDLVSRPKPARPAPIPPPMGDMFESPHINASKLE